MGLNQYESAVNDFTAALRREPDNGYFYRMRGDANYARHANAAALADYTKALQLDPNDLFAMNGRGIALDAIGDYGKSLKQFNEMLRRDPRSALGYGNRAGTWWDLGEYEKTLADLNRAIQLDPKLAVAYSNRGRWFMKPSERNSRCQRRCQPYPFFPPDPPLRLMALMNELRSPCNLRTLQGAKHS
jgi:tetratricopeptide (TPR) repeat protein